METHSGGQQNTVTVAIGISHSRDSGWSYARVGTVIFLSGRIIVSGKKPIPTAHLAAQALGGIVGALAAAPLTKRLDRDKAFEVDPSLGRAMYDDRRRVAKLELSDGRWLALTVTTRAWVVGKTSKQAMAEDRKRLLESLEETYGSRLERTRIVNRRVTWALRVLVLFVLPLLLGLIIVAILGFSGMLD